MYGNVFTLSPTRAVSYKHSGGAIHPFSGSSLLRKKAEPKANKVSKETQGEDGKTVHEDALQNADELLCTCEELQQTDKRSGNTDRAMSARTRRKVKDKAMCLIYSTGRTDFYFLTLTFINRVQDKNAVQVLNKFLTALRDEYGKFAYIWVAERQNKNKQHPGNIHFHVITDLRIDVVKFNALWVMQQYNADITHDKHSYADILQHYKQGTIKKVLNPLDVRYARNIDKVAAYLTTYVTKNKDSFQCAPWHCSRSVSELCTAQRVDKDIVKQADDISYNSVVDEQTGEVKYEPKTYVTEHGTVTYILNKKYFKTHINELIKLNSYLLYRKKEDKPEGLPHYFQTLMNLN